MKRIMTGVLTALFAAIAACDGCCQEWAATPMDQGLPKSSSLSLSKPKRMQTFTPSTSYEATSVELWLTAGCAGYGINVNIATNCGDVNSPHLTTTSAAAPTTDAGGGVDGWLAFPLSLQLSAATTYCIRVETTGLPDTCAWSIGPDDYGGGHAWAGTGEPLDDEDFAFKVMHKECVKKIGCGGC